MKGTQLMGALLYFRLVRPEPCISSGGLHRGQGRSKEFSN